MDSTYKRGFENLEVWKKCRDMRLYVAQLYKCFPKDELYNLTLQIKNSSRSVTANIAEGYGRYHYQENTLLPTFPGSLEETKDHLYTALDEKYVTQEEFAKFLEHFDHCLRLLNGYIAYMQNEKLKAKS